ncbi:Nonribosomal peptide synthetase dtxS1 [Cladobotryum mycophilum]|uniref:Nonribosomal peptide synthetase dtxS1 n=1 Tax=Cladobotryum mycophilum TaxID=491253 RepID=A0ABR0SHK0_9HYPO
MNTEQDLARIWRWNATVPEAVDVCVHNLIAKQWNQSPEASPAVCAWDGQLTYGELDSLSTQLSHQLIELGVAPEVVVPLLFEKSMWVPVAMLAVMKAGGASCLLDVTQPETRLRALVTAIQAPVVLCSAQSAGLVDSLFNSSSDGPIALTIDKKYWEQLPLASAQLTTPATTVQPDNALYVVFTSGSTGMPKGVVITHANFSSALVHQGAALEFTKSSRVLDLASYAFDAAWYNALHTFYAGGCLCIPSEQERQNDLLGCIRRLQPNFINMTPKLSQFLDAESLRGLDIIELAGEQADPRQVMRLRQAGRTKVRFAYGPAEASILSTVSTETAPYTNIGTGLGVRTWIVDTADSHTLAPVGSIGELWIEGPLVGRGYLNDQEKTASAFVTDPPWLLNGAPGFPGRRGRLYRTGDLVRYSEEDEQHGSLVFVGRRDAQVKIHGQRVELGEIEQQILAGLDHKLYEDFQVVVQMIRPRGSDNHTLLVAFVQAVDVPAVVTQLQYTLPYQLPKYAIPSIYIPVDHMPVGPTGKTDRRRLRELGDSLSLEELTRSNLARSSRWREPETADEIRLQALWASVLGVQVDSIGAEDSFLQIGGDSIMAMRLVAKAWEERINFTVADVFTYPRLCDLAVAINKTLPPKEDDDLVIAPFSLLRSEEDETELRHAASRLCNLEPSQVEDIFPCTPLQEGLISLTAKNAGDGGTNGSYVVQSVVELKFTTDVDRFKAAWEVVVAKEPILRTRIVDLGQQHSLVQVVVAHDSVEWITEPTKAGSMGLGTPLTRFELVVNDTEKLFVCTMHHAVCDGWSWPLLLEKLEKVYLEGEETLLQPSPPFQVFVKNIQDTIEPAADLWRQQLEGTEAQPFPRLPSLNYQPKADSHKVHNITGFHWPTATSNATPSTLIRAAWSILSAQYTGLDDIIFGATVSGRQAAVPGIERMTGPTIVTVPVRVVLNRQETVKDMLARIQQQATEMTAIEQMGLQSIRRLSEDAQRACQFGTLMIIQPAASKKKSTLFVKKEDGSYRGAGDWDLAAFNSNALLLECRLLEQDQQHGEAIQIRASFDSAVLDLKQIERMLQQLEHVLRQLCLPSNDSKELGELNLACGQDLQDIWTWNKSIPKGVDECVHHLVTEMGKIRPDAPAICAWDGNLTYAELETLSSRLGHHLATLGVGPETIVPLCFEKSMWVPVAMLGVLKAGGAFTFLPPSVPRERLATIVESIKPLVAMTNPQHATFFPNIKVVSPMEILSQAASGQDFQRTNHSDVNPSSMAVVIFTSGTTGTPKGIMLDHRCLSTTARFMGRDSNVGPETRVFQFSSYLFDMGIHEAFIALVAGSCLCIPSEFDRENNLSASLTKFLANWIFLTPSVARAIPTDSIPTLETLVFGGEALMEADVTRWAGHKMEMFNFYGPAESPFSTAAIVSSIVSWRGSPIGFGAAVNCWVIERGSTADLSQLALVGAVGELVVEGPIVMKGYHKNAEKTAAVLIDDPSWLARPSYPGQNSIAGRRGRLLRTGDLVQQSLDGSLTYLGRDDVQVKIRGQRVDLGDVEHHVHRNLNLPPSSAANARVVAEVILTPRGDKQVNTATLVAFVQDGSSGDDSVREDEAQLLDPVLMTGLGRLSEALPRYMIPTVYISIAKIPITTGGKINRAKLRNIGLAFITRNSDLSMNIRPSRRQPSTPAEKQLQKLWASILEDEALDIGADDSFIQVGGDSIAAMRLVAAARRQGLFLTVADVFRRPRLSDMATVVVERAEKTAELVKIVKPFSLLRECGTTDDFDTFIHRNIAPQLVSKASGSVLDAFPVTYWQASCIGLALQTPPRQLNHFFVDIPGKTPAQVAKICDTLWKSHDILRILFVRSGDEYLQILQEHIQPKIFHHSTKGSLKRLTTKICEEDLRHPVVLGLPFTRFYICSGSTEKSVRLIIRLSHAQYDATSLMHMLRSIEALLHDEPQTPSTGMSALIQHAQKNKDSCLPFWRNLLQGSNLTRLQQMPSIHPSNSISGSLPVYVRKLVPKLCPTGDFTPATIFTSACAAFLMSTVKSSDVTFGRLVSGRAMLPVHLRSSVIGPTLNIIPVRVRKGSTEEGKDEHSLSSISTKKQQRQHCALLQSVHEQYVDSLPFDTISFDDLKAHCATEDWPQEARSFGCVTQYQDMGDVIEGSGYRLESYEDSREGVKIMMEDNIIVISAKPAGNNSLVLELAASRRYYTEHLVQQWAERLAVILGEFYASD